MRPKVTNRCKSRICVSSACHAGDGLTEPSLVGSTIIWKTPASVKRLRRKRVLIPVAIVVGVLVLRSP